MVLWVVWYALFCCDENAGELGTKFFLRVIGVAKSVIVVQSPPVQTAWVTGPVPQLVQGGAVIAGCVLEGFLRWKMYGVSSAVVESAVSLIVGNVCATVL